MKHLNLFSVLLLCAVLFSCGGGGEGIDTNMIPVETNDGKFIYINQKGKTVLELEDKKASYFSDGLAYFYDYESSLYGYINKKGKVVIEPQFSKAENFSEGIAWVTKPNGCIEAINTKGKTLFSLEGIYSVMDFREGLATFEKFDEEGNRLYGVINKKGKVVIEPTENEIGFFRHGVAKYESDFNYGLIDKSGKIIVNPQFDEILITGNEDLFAVKMGEWGIINKKGEYVINPRYQFIAPDGDKFLYREDRQSGWCNKKGESSIVPQFDNAHLFLENDLALIEKGRKKGYTDKKGKLTIPYQFDQATSFIDNNVAIIELNGKYGLIDKKGKYIVNPMYEDVSSDFLYYAFEGYLNPEKTITDYFDTEASISTLSTLVNNEYIDGDLYLAPIKSVMEKYGLTEDKFSKYSKSKVLLKKGRIDDFINYELYAEEYPWKKVSNGWWSYNYIFNNDHPVQNYIITYKVSLLKSEKTGDLAKEIIKYFGSNPGSDFSSGHVHSDYDNKKQYAISYSGSDVNVKITQLVDQTSNYEANPESAGDDSFSISLSDTESCDGGSITLTIKGGKPFDDANEPFKVEYKHKSGSEAKMYPEKFKSANGAYTLEIGTGTTDESFQTLIVTDASGKTQTIDFTVVNCP
ncbi:WG repeat-containing protein [Bacteroidales bacterium OttesenSCG-928-M11]|nr:WG repeat-containing protein [Bacteroidales bacterium OttesenSCG-928-M11]